MAVFSTNLLIYKHTDFEQTFILEDSQSNSAKDLTGFTGTCKMQSIKSWQSNKFYFSIYK